MLKRSSIIICYLILLLVCGCDKKENFETEKKPQKEEVKEEVKIDDDKKEQEIEDNGVIEKESIHKPVSSNKKEEVKKDEKKTDKTTSNHQKEETLKEEIKAPSIVGTWIYNNGDYVYIFENDKLIEIKTKTNTIKEHSYTIDGNKIIIDGKTVRDFEIKGDKLYLGYTVLTKAPNNYKYPSIYGNLDIFYGTWKLETSDKLIMLEDGYEKTLEETMTLNKNNMSGFGSCGGSGCYSYIFNFLNIKPELYTGSLCYQLVDNNTLTQIKCHSDNIIGYPGWEDETLHNIVYKRTI